MLLREAAKQHEWNLNNGAIALMWRGGCIIRSVFLGNIKSAFEKNESLENLLLDEFFTDAINKCQQGWRKVVATATVYGVPIPCLSTGRKKNETFCCFFELFFLFQSFGVLRWLSIETFACKFDSGEEENILS